MHAGIYKPGQGYWTRTMSAIGYGLLVLMGGVWTWDLTRGVRIGEIQPVYISGAAALVFIAIGGWCIYYFLGRKRRVVDFMIATEGEMKKVNWSSKREIWLSTWVVIGLTVFIALVTFACDTIFSTIFRFFGVLDEIPSA